MAQYITMKQVPGGTVTAVDDRILYDTNLSSGVIYGCEVSYIGNNMIHINAGYGVIKGGLFEMEDHVEYVDYAEKDPTPGQIYLKFDAAAVDKLVIIKETTPLLHIMEQDEDANFDSGVYEIQLCTFTATTTTLTDVTQTFPEASGSVDILDSLAEISANVSPNKCAGALAVKQLNSNMGDMQFRINANKPEWKATGADTWLPFKSDLESDSFTKIGQINNSPRATTNFTFPTGWEDYDYFVTTCCNVGLATPTFTNLDVVFYTTANTNGSRTYWLKPNGGGTPAYSIKNTDAYLNTTELIYGVK